MIKYINELGFSNKTKSFIGVERLKKNLQKLGLKIIKEEIDLIYGNDCQRPFQDYDGFRLEILIEKINNNLLLIALEHYNGTTGLDKYFYKFDGDLKEQITENDFINSIS